jgi:hypothetical protein
MYIAVGVAVPTTVIATTIAMARMRRRTIYRGVPILIAASLIISRLVLIASPFWFYPVLYVLMNLASTLGSFYCWGIAGAICDTREAKRLFPVFAAGGILGSSIGGLLTPLVVSLVGAANLILIWGIMVGATAVLAFFVTREVPERPLRVRRRTRPLRSFAQGYREVTASRLFPSYLAMTALFVALFFLLSFSFSRLSIAEFPDEVSLAGFFGLFQGVATGTGLLVSIFVAPRLFSRVGFLGALVLYGAVFVVGFAVTSAFPLFVPVVVFRYLQLAVYLGIAGPAYQAVFSVSPQNARERTRLLVDGVFGQFGMVLAGAALILLNRLPGLRFHFVTAIAPALGALGFALLARARYGDQVRSALRAGGAGLFDRGRWLTADTIDSREVQIALESFASQDVVSRRAAAGILSSIATSEVIDALVGGLGDVDSEVRRLCAEGLGNSGASGSLLELRRMLSDESPRVRRQAVDAIARLTSYEAGLRETLEPMLEDGDARVRAVAAAALARLNVPNARERLSGFLSSKNPRIVRLALDAFELVPDLVPVRKVATLLAHPNGRLANESASVLARVGGRSEPVLGELLRADEAVEQPPAECVLSVYSDMGRVRDPEPLVRFSDHCLERLGSYRTVAAQLDSVIVDGTTATTEPRSTAAAIEESARRLARWAIWARALAAGRYDHLVVEGLVSGDPETRSYAVESIESLGLDDSIEPALETIERGAAASGMTGESASPIELVRVIEALGDAWATACALYELGQALPHDQIDRFVESAYLMIADAAEQASSGDNIMKETESMSLIQRMLFLKQTSIFAGLTPEELEGVASICEEQEFLTGEVLDEEGATGDCMYLIVSGSVRIVRGAHQEEIARRLAGEAIGEMSLLSHRSRTATMIAGEPVKVLIVNHRAFEQILRKSPDVCLAVMQALSDRLVEAGQRSEEAAGR